MASSTQTASSSKENFAQLLQESYGTSDGLEGSVVKGKVIAIENDTAVIDVGLKSEGRIPLREFSERGKAAEIRPGDEVEVFLERMENAMGEAVLSRERRAARRRGPSLRSRSRPTSACKACCSAA